MKRRFLSATIVGLMVPILGLAGTQASSQNAPNMPNMANMPMMQNCAMSVKGAEIVTEDTQDGISVTITTKTGDVAELRRRVENMAKMHSTAKGETMAHGMMIPFTATYAEVPNGARLTLKPNDPAQLAEFRTRVREHAARMKEGDCSSMMQCMMQGMMSSVKGSESAKPEAKPESKPKEEDHSAHHPAGEAK